MTDRATVVDCERHPVVGSLDDLVPHMATGWAERVRRSEFRLPPPVPHPGVDLEPGPLTGGEDPARVAATIPAEVAAVILVPAQVMPSAGWLDGALAAAFASAVNDHLIERWLPADPRFRLAIGLAPHDADLAARELRRIGSTAGVVAAAMPLGNVSMGATHHHPVYEAACDLGLPLIVHPSGVEGQVLGAPALGGCGPRTPEETFSLLPQVAAANIAGIVFDGVFERFPTLKVAFAGYGWEWAPPILWRLDQEWRNLRYAVPWLTRPPSDYVADHVRLIVDGATPAADRLGEMAAMLPDGVLLYGSDAPFRDASPDESLRPLPESMRARVGHENAASTFGTRL